MKVQAKYKLSVKGSVTSSPSLRQRLRLCPILVLASSHLEYVAI